PGSVLASIQSRLAKAWKSVQAVGSAGAALLRWAPASAARPASSTAAAARARGRTGGKGIVGITAPLRLHRGIGAPEFSKRPGGPGAPGPACRDNGYCTVTRLRLSPEARSISLL